MKSKLTIYFAVLIGSLILISFFGGTVSYAIFFAIALIPVLSYGYLLTVFAGFKIYQKIDSRDVVTNVPMGYYFILKNDGFVSFSSIQIRMFSSFSEIEELPSESEFCLLPGEEYRFDTRIFCKYRGEYEVGIKEVILTDFLKLFKLKYKIPSTIKAIVMPEITHLSQFGALDKATSVSSKETMQGDSLDVVVRDYVSGDSLRSISWKATARENRLMTRLTFGEEKQGIAVVIDQKRYSEDEYVYLPTEDKLLKTMLASVTYVVNRGVPVTIASSNYRIGTMQDFNGYYASLEQFYFDEKYELDNTLQTQVRQLAQCKIVMIFAQSLTDRSLLYIKELSDGDTYVMLYLIDNQEKGQDYLSLLGSNSFRGKIISISPESSLEEVLS